MSIDCPHCGGRSRVRTSREATPLVRDAQLQCMNVECGHTFAAQLVITHTIVPSQMPRADVMLPMAKRRLAIANDNCGLAVPPVPIAATG